MELVDAHCHFDFPAFDDQREAILDRARAVGLSRLVIPGVRKADWDRVRSVVSQFDGLFYCLGIHPWFIAEHDQSHLEALKQELKESLEGCVALGECGLDRIRGDLSAQLPWFEAQVDIAVETGFPLVVHSVRTHDEVGVVLKRKPSLGPVLIHGFSGSVQQARKLVDLGCFIGVGGVVTHDRARKTRNTIAQLPLDCLVLETDAPDMAPQGVEKGRNSPEYLGRIFEALAELRSESEDVLAAQLWSNSCRLYRW